MAKKLVPIEEGQASDPPLTMGNLIEKARHDWELGKKNEAFHTVLSGMMLLSKGVKKALDHADEHDAIMRGTKQEEK